MADYPTVPELVAKGLNNNDGIACATKRNGEWVTTSASEFAKQATLFARGLYALGIRKGDRVGLHAESSTRWLIIDQAILSLGAVSVPIYTTQPGEQIHFILDDAGASLYIVSNESLYGNCPPSVRELPVLKHVIGIYGSFADLSYNDVIERGRVQDPLPPEELTGEDLATIIYTSGTTGRPKGVMLTHGNIGSNLTAVADRLPVEIPATMLSYLPLSHSFERAASLAYLLLRCPVWFVENTEEIKEDIATVKPAHMTTVPRLLEKVHAGLNQVAVSTPGAKGALLRWALRLAESHDPRRGRRGLKYLLAEKLVYSKIRDNFGGNLKAFTSGGAALAPNIQAFFNGIGIICGQGYGLTESSPAISYFTPSDIRLGSVGTAIQGVEVRIAEDGEILARGPNIMQGYYNLPEKTAETIDADGWLHTGDIGRMDEDGHLYITDRKKQLFKLSTGKYIAPTPIEMDLCNSSLVEQAVVIGPARKFCAALITVDPATVRSKVDDVTDPATDSRVRTMLQEVVDEVNRTRPIWEQVKKFAVIPAPFTIESGELTPTMKVKRRVVKERYRDQIEALYA